MSPLASRPLGSTSSSPKGEFYWAGTTLCSTLPNTRPPSALSCNSSPGELPPWHVLPAASPRARCCSHQCNAWMGKGGAQTGIVPSVWLKQGEKLLQIKELLCSVFICVPALSAVISANCLQGSWRALGMRLHITTKLKAERLQIGWNGSIIQKKKQHKYLFSLPPSLYFYPHHRARESAEHIELKVANLSFKPLYF